jgi:predicted outer membrane protein
MPTRTAHARWNGSVKTGRREVTLAAKLADGQQMVTDHTAVNKQATALVTKLRSRRKPMRPARVSNRAATRTSRISKV